MSINLSALMKQRYDTAANWTAQNPTLLAGEIGIESDTKKWKVGTGSTAWTSLVYAIGGTYPIVNADIAAGAGIVDTKLATIATAGKVSNSATTAASANTASAIVARDASGNFTASTITAALTGAASSNVLKAGDTMTGVLAVTSGPAALPGIAVSGDPNTGIYSPGADQLAISTGGTNRAIIDSSGRLLVGTSSARGNFRIGATNYNSAQQLELASQGFQSFVGGSSSGGGPYLILAHQRSGAVGGNTAVVSGDEMGTVSFHGADGTNLVIGAAIRGEVDGTPGANDMPGRLVFSTTADGAASSTERMRITSTGQMRLAGAGITFNGDTATANELDDYEEGTWTGTDGSGAGLSIAFVGGRYTKIGRLVYVSAETITYPVTANTSNAALAGLPFTNGGQSTGVAALITTNVNANRALVVANTTTAFFYANSSLTTTTNIQLSGAIIYAFTAVYQV
jgi:hypothetical protein